MPFRNQWRDVQSLHRDGMPIDTSRDETAKLFDAALTQYTGWYNDSNYDGLDSTLARLLASDPECVTSRILFTGLNLMNTAVPFKSMVETTIQSLGDIQSSNRYVNLHCQALLDCSRGHFSRACNTWEQCIVEYPFDMMAIKFVSDCYFYTGNRPMIRDSIARVLPIWEESRDRPLKSYLYGMHAFGLGENNMIERSEKEALYGLELNPNDAWATHALAHALEYAGREHDGADFLKKTHQDWIKCDVIKPHIDWHWALYELEQGNHDFAEDILFNHILNKNSDLILLDFVDAAALIYRLKLAGQSQSKTYDSARLKNFLDEHLHDHVLLFNDLHMYFLLNDEYYAENRDEFLRTLKETYENSDSDNANVYRDFGRILFQAIDEFRSKNYAAVVNLVYPIRNQIYQIGGSNAQRDLFFLLLIHAAVHSDDRQHQSLARQLLNERCWLRNKTQSRMMKNYTNALLH